MVFKRKNYSTTTEILDLMKADDEIMRSTAVFYFHRKDKVSGKIYFRKGAEPGLVYAAHVSNMPFHIGKRIKPLIEADEYEEILRQVGGDDTDPNIARLAVSKQLVAEKTVDALIREYLFSAAAEIFTWQEVIGTWEIGTETQDFASRHYIGLELLQKKAADRDLQYASMIAETKLSEEEIENLKVLRKGSIEDFADIENRNLQSIIEFADGRNTVSDVRDETGLLKIPAFLGIHALWNVGRLQLIAGEIPVYPPNFQHEESEESEEDEDIAEPLAFAPEETIEEDYEDTLEDEDYEEDQIEAENHVPVQDNTESTELHVVNENLFPTESLEAEDFEDSYGIENFPEPIALITTTPLKEEDPEEEEQLTEQSIQKDQGSGVFEKLYARIEDLQKEVNNSDANIKKGELAVRAIDKGIKDAEESILRLKSERSQAIKDYHAIVARGKDSKEKLEKIIASIDSLTAG